MKDDLLYVGHIYDAVARILEYTAPGKEHFFREIQCQDAVMRNFGVIGEAVKHMSEERKSAHPEIPWKAVVGMRHKVVHDYMNLDEDVVWDTVQQDLPPLIEKLSQIDGV